MEWISVEEKLPDELAGKFIVRKLNGNVLEAFYYSDAMAWIAFYGKKTSHWWDANGMNKRLDNVTHWKEISPTPESQ